MLRDHEKNKGNRHHRVHTKTKKMEMGRSYRKNEGRQMDQTQHRVTDKKRTEIKRTTKQKMARRHSKRGGNHLEQESIRQKTMQGANGGLYLAMDRQSLGER